MPSFNIIPLPFEKNEKYKTEMALHMSINYLPLPLRVVRRKVSKLFVVEINLIC